MYKVKIQLDQITLGPQEPTPADIALLAPILLKHGYRRTSNAYCSIARIDRDDWIDYLATKLNCCVADFYKKDGSGIADSWRDHYVRVYSKDKHTVAPELVRKIKSW